MNRCAGCGTAIPCRHDVDLSPVTRRQVTGLVSAVVIGAGLVGSLVLAHVTGPCDPSQDGCRFDTDGVTYQTYQGVSWPVCEFDEGDGPACLWDGSRDGDGRGGSFTRDGNGNVTVIHP